MVAKFFLFTALLSVGCGQPDTPRTVRGVYIHAFEISDFRECGAWSTAWLNRTETPAPTGWDKVESALRQRSRGNTAYVEMTAHVRGPGRYGHLNMYWYEVTPIEVTLATPEVPAECGS